MTSLLGSKHENPLEYYAHQGPMTDPRTEAGMFDGLPAEVSALCGIVQDVLIHVFWAERYGLSLSQEREQEVQIRPVSEKLKRVRELDDRPLTETRPFQKRLVGNCRDFSLMLCAMLRHQRIPARARCGFGAYFAPNHYEDHWICEYWNRQEQRWIMVDAQLDSFQKKKLDIRFDPLGVPNDQFLTGGKAWLMCRACEANPDQFGIFDKHGLRFVRGNLIRDLGSLNKMELLPWDCWGLIDKDEKKLSETDIALLDRVAMITLADNNRFSDMRSIYENDTRLRVPATIRSYLKTGVQTVEIKT